MHDDDDGITRLWHVCRYGLLKKSDGTLLQNPPENHVFEPGDRVVALSRSGARTEESKCQ